MSFLGWYSPMLISEPPKSLLPFLGHGIGLRPVHYPAILAEKPAIDWLEIMTEDYLDIGGRPLYYLHQIKEHYPMVMHGVSLSIGSSDAVDFDYLAKVKKLADELKPAWISDHLCWTGVDQFNMHDLLPLPYTDDALKQVVSKVKQVQDYLERPILLENVSSYISFKQSEMNEWEFLSAVAEHADCLILLDINNVYVSAFNHGFNPKDYLLSVPTDRVQQFHLAGHQNFGDYIIDTHDHPIIDPVWELYAEAVKHFGRVSTMIERDDNIPPLAELLNELAQAKQIFERVLAQNIGAI